ncbi:putative flippase GtrA [Motilibacter peucedani]|uniref:Putative flippase GtrA n=1 Tax=Motilibacter peucedani TaxID=598650 RepID=A0A420XN75_9ACTN|nr:GtrA family protein [Motilibacter peucedani]RKS72737.1 putative flippase GtrA [Motilibacter peucedani]
MRAVARRHLRTFSRYGIGSVVAAVTSELVFVAVVAAGGSTLAANVAGFLAGAVPNYALNIGWAWRHREGSTAVRLRRYAVVSVVSALAAYATTTLAESLAGSLSGTSRTLLLGAVYLGTYAVLFVAKYVALDRYVFSTPTGGGTAAGREARAPRSRHHVPSTTRR